MITRSPHGAKRNAGAAPGFRFAPSGLQFYTPSPPELMRPQLDLELADRGRVQAYDVAGLDRAHARRRAGVVHIARIERVERGGKLDQAADIEDQVLGLGGLLELVVEVQRDRDIVRIGHL